MGRRKEKKDKKDRGYATLDGESSPEEDFETKLVEHYHQTLNFRFNNTNFNSLNCF